MNKLISRLIDKAGVKPETREKVATFVAENATKLPLPDKAKEILKKAGVGEPMHTNEPDQPDTDKPKP